MNRDIKSQKSLVVIVVCIALGALVSGCSDQPQMNRPSDICNQGLDLIADFPEEASVEALDDYRLKVKDFFDSSLPSEARELLGIYLDSISAASEDLDSIMSIQQNEPSYNQAETELTASWEQMTEDGNALFDYCSSIDG